jgi:hypothetical protein
MARESVVGMECSRLNTRSTRMTAGYPSHLRANEPAPASCVCGLPHDALPTHAEARGMVTHRCCSGAPGLHAGAHVV